MNEPRHKQIVVPYKGTRIQIDKGMRVILPLMWESGIDTLFSCEGDAFFKDETVWSNKPHRAYVMMVRNDAAILFVHDLLMHYPAFKPGKKILFDFEFDRNNHRTQTRLGRLTMRFPNSDIDPLCEFLDDRLKW
jgi:hypothetical protein